MIWLEAFFKKLPFDYRDLKLQLLARLSFLGVLWVSGYLIYSLEGLSKEYISNLSFLFSLLITNMIPLYGTFMVQKSMPLAVREVEPLLDLSTEEFENLFTRTMGYVYNFKPVLIIALALLLVSNLPIEIITLQTDGLRIRLLWDLFIEFFFYLINGTALWLGFSIWLTILTISRQPFNHSYREISERFRGLAMLILWFSAFYFIAISLGVASSLFNSSVDSALDILFSPLLLFLLFGFLLVFFPFFNIHQALSRIKQAKLIQIEKEYEVLIYRMRGDFSQEDSIEFVRELLDLQLKERLTSNMNEWPVNMGFVTKLLTLVLIPAIVRISIELVNKYLI